MRHAHRIIAIVLGMFLVTPLQAQPPLPGHILVLDTSIGLIDIDPITGESFTAVPGGIGISEMAIDANGDVLVLEFDSIMRVDPATGAQTTVAPDLHPDGTNLYPAGIVIERNGDILVTLWDIFPNKTTPGRILRVDPSNGSHTTLTSDNLLGALQGIALDENGDILVVTQELSVPGPPAGIVRVDPITGAQSDLSTGSGYDLPAGIVLDTDGTILVSDYGSPNRLLRVDPADADPMPVLVTSGGLFSSPFGLDVEPDGNIIVGNIDSAVGVVRVDPNTSQQSLANAPGNFDVPLFPRVLTHLVKNGKPLGRFTMRSSQTLAPGETLEGDGVVDAPVVGAIGSTISATTGDMRLGDTSLAGGFSTQGSLHTGSNTVILQSADAVLLEGEISILGGTLNVATGITLAPGADLVADGTIDADVIALPGSSMLVVDLVIGSLTSYASINVNGGTQTFTGPVTSFGEINAFDATLDFQGDGVANNDGLTNYGELRLVTTTVNGDVHSSEGSVIRVVDAAVFTGLVSGAADFLWPGLVQFNGVYDPGDSTAAIAFAGDVAFDATATLRLEIGGTQAGTGFDQLDIAGNAALSGTAMIEVIGGFDPQAGQSFVVMTFGSRIDEFDNVTGLDIDGGKIFVTAYHDNDVTLTVVELVPADFDIDGDVDLDDFGEFQACSTGPAQGPPPPGCEDMDLDGDGDVDQTDFGLFQRCISGANEAADPGCAP